MKSKIMKMLTAIMLVAVLAVTVVGCDLFTSSDTIELVNAPMTEWVVKEKPADEDALTFSLKHLRFTAKVTTANGVYTVKYDGATGEGATAISVTGFNITTPGKNRVAVVEYNGAEGLSTTFTYNVSEMVSGEGLLGAGTVEDPFQIRFAEDFVTIAQDSETYAWNANYVLVDNIDFGDVDSIAYATALINSNFNFVGTLDGQGYTISNMSLAGAEGYEDGEQTQIGLFYMIAPTAPQVATIKNINFYNCSITNSSAAGAAILGQGAYQFTGRGTVVIDNVDMDNCHVSAMKNSSLYIGYAAGENFIFKNCDVASNCSVITTSHSAGSFIGSGNYIGYHQKLDASGNPVKDDKGNIVYNKGGSVSFDACSSAAKLVSTYNAHGFIGNKSGGPYTVTRSNGSKYTGIIYQTTTTEHSDISKGTFYNAMGLENTSLDNYTVHNTAIEKATVGYKAIASIKAISLSLPEVGGNFSIPAVDGGVDYIFSYSLARGGSSYGDSVTVKVINGTATSVGSIKRFSAVYDYYNEAYGEEVIANAFTIKGALREISASTYKDNLASITYYVTVLNANGEIVASGKVEDKISAHILLKPVA